MCYDFLVVSMNQSTNQEKRKTMQAMTYAQLKSNLYFLPTGLGLFGICARMQILARCVIVSPSLCANAPVECEEIEREEVLIKEHRRFCKFPRSAGAGLRMFLEHSSHLSLAESWDLCVLFTALLTLFQFSSLKSW